MKRKTQNSDGVVSLSRGGFCVVRILQKIDENAMIYSYFRVYKREKIALDGD